MDAERNAAKSLLRALDEPAVLRGNELLVEFQECAHEERRAAALQALEGLAPGTARGPAAERAKRKHQILLRCDVRDEPLESVAADLGLSIRQFYRERSEAFEDFVAMLKAAPRAANPAKGSVSDTDVAVMRERYLLQLRACGMHDAMWREATALATDLGEDERAIGIWTIAAEAARYTGDLRRSSEAIGRAKHLRESLALAKPVAGAILVAISEIALHWTRGEYVRASARLEDAVRECAYGQGLFGLDAALFGIMLTYGLSCEIERGRWEEARSLLRALSETERRTDPRHTSPSSLRHSGRLALRAHQDERRAIVDLRESLAAAQRFDNLAGEASASTELGVALAGADAEAAQRYIRYGLETGRKVLGRNEYAMLAVGAMPSLLQLAGVERVRELLEEVRRSGPLAGRSLMACDLAEAALYLRERKYRAAIERTEGLLPQLESNGLELPAAEATLIRIASLAGAGRKTLARRALSERWELVQNAVVKPSSWTHVLGSNLAVHFN